MLEPTTSRKRTQHAGSIAMLDGNADTYYSAERHKRRKYASHGSGYIFESLGVETLGPWGPGAHLIFKNLSERLVDAMRDQNAGLFPKVVNLPTTCIKMSHLKGEEIVISGISGIFPNAGNLLQLGENLFNKVEMVTKTTKYPFIKNIEFPPYVGEINDLEFDAHFFRVTARQAKCLDPSVGKLLEQTFCALFDAGINPETLKGSKMGVYIALMQMDMANYAIMDEISNPFRITGISKTMTANRISYWIDGKGPSFCFDNGSVGSMAAFEMAYKALKNDEIDCAIVGGTNFCSLPILTLNMNRAGLLCMDGKTKCFDKTGDGFVRSSAVNVFFLQKAKDAKRIYSEVCHVKGKYFASPDGIFTAKRNPKDIEQFLEEFYSEVDVSPADVEYIEANSFGIAEADKNELEAIGNIFTKNGTIRIGSVKSNMGNTEAASGACAVTKMCLAYQKGKIPPNLHFNKPHDDINAVKEGKLQVVTETVPFGRNFTAINNFCYTGSNFHALLNGHYKPKDTERYKSSFPRLVLASGRKEDVVNKMLDILETNPIDPEQCALINNFYKHNVPGYTGRGYTILDTNENNETVCLSRGFEFYSGNTRPVWFLFSGMGSQWAGMGEGLLRIPVFAAAIEKCHQLLFPKGLDIIKIITDKNSGSFNILNSIVAITAIQIGICDVLSSLGIVPDNIIGHSVGEIACAYADGSLTVEETILASYYRGLSAYETELIKGTMAAVGLGHNEVAMICPPEIDIACHNSFESTTISGPADVVSKFVKNLTNQGIFAKEVNSYDIAFHSRYIANAGPKMLALLKNVITDPKLRSKKWLTTCYLPKDWHKPESQFMSAEYMVHNLLSSVFFEEAASFIPEDALIIEIAPHGLLQAIMKKSHSQCVNLSLTKRGEIDSAVLLLKSIGNLYQIGLNIDLEALYPKVEYPVSTETPILSHLIGWDYSINRDPDDFVHDDESNAKEITISIYDDDYEYLKNYVRNGVSVLPEAAMLVFAWKSLADLFKMDYKNMSVKFQDIKIHKQIITVPDKVIRLGISLQQFSNRFEIVYENKTVVDGLIFPMQKKNDSLENIQSNENENENEKHLTQNEIYKILRARGHFYETELQSIKSLNINKNKASVKWNEHWVTFLDSIIQLNALSNDHDGVSHVKLIRQLTIDTKKHKYTFSTSNGIKLYNAFISKNAVVVKCGGVTLRDLIFKKEPKIQIVPNIRNNLKINVTEYGNSERFTKNFVGGKNCVQRIELIAKELDDIESLTWTDAPVISSKPLIQVYYSGLSMKDCKKLSCSDNHCFGMDFSGVNENGEKVMGLLPGGALSSAVEADYDLLWPVPQHWTMAEAATVPLPFIQAFYCLAIRNSVEQNSNLFIIGAAGALGQAVICVALSLGCTIFGTVANADKKRFLLKLFPELDENNIGFTYDDSFPAMVNQRTKKRKCQVVISSASGKVREAAMRCVGFMGNFLDLNDSDQIENKDFPMFFITESKSYKSVVISTIFAVQKYKKILHSMLSEGIAKGCVRPLTFVTFLPLDVSRAFNLISTRINIGRVLINMKELAVSKQDLVQIPRISPYPTKSYILLWDGSEVGVELIDLFIKRGAKRLLVHCDPKFLNEYLHMKYASWKKSGAIIDFNSDTLQTEDKCRSLTANTEIKLGSIDGIFITCSDFGKTSKIFDGEKDNIATMVSRWDKVSRNLDLRYFAVITAVLKNNVVNECEFQEIEQCCSLRNKLGYPSLFLRHTLEHKILRQNSVIALLNALELSLEHQYVNVRSAYAMDNGIQIKEDNVTKLKLNTNFKAGLNAFWQQISSDEIDATEPIVRMKINIDSNFERELTVDPDDAFMIMIPGFEGNSEAFTTISEQLKIRSIVLQLDPNYNDNISQIAKTLLKYVKARYHIKSPFYLMGFSFGVNIALEMAALLEKEGLFGVVYCLDSSPDALRIHLDAYLGILTDEQLQNCLIEHCYTLLAGVKSEELKQMIKKTTKWSEKVEIFIKKAKNNVHHSHEYLRSLLQAVHVRINMAKAYKPTLKLNSDLVLLKGIPHPNAKQLSEDYNLSKYTDKPVTVFDIESDHAMALFDGRIPNYINRLSKANE